MRALLRGLLVVLGSGLLAGSSCLPIGGRRDLSAFQRFEYAQMPALGFCPSLDAIYRASITRQSDGTYSLEMSTITEGEQGVDTCLDDEIGFTVPECIVVHEMPARILTDQEVQQVQDVFSDVGVETRLRGMMCIDPCVVFEYRWDDLALTDAEVGCGPGFEQILSVRSAEAMVQLLEALQQGTE
jgi:hypothetical protein